MPSSVPVSAAATFSPTFSGPSEIASVNRGFNRMLANLRQIERDRAVLLAGVSHDLRTPLARLRLGIEMSARDEAMRNGMVEDIDEGSFAALGALREPSGVTIEAGTLRADTGPGHGLAFATTTLRELPA